MFDKQSVICQQIYKQVGKSLSWIVRHSYNNFAYWLLGVWYMTS